VQDDEIADDGVERAVLEWKLVHVRLAEVESGVQAGGERDHCAGDVDADHVRPALSGASRHVARAGCEIQHPRPAAHSGGVQQGVGEPARNPAEELVIPVCPLLPARRLEGVEGIRVDLWWAHDGRR
jgi:hypothetical protein